MSTFSASIHGVYCKIHSYPKLVLGIILLLCLLAAVEARNFHFDASADTMIAQSDPELAFFNEVTETFGEGSFLVLTYTPDSGSLFARERLDQLQSLTDELQVIEGVVGVTSILDVPLLQSPPVPIAELAEGYRTLRDQDVSLELARDELIASPMFKELLVSADGQSTAIQINIQSAATSQPDSQEVSLLSNEDLVALREWAKQEEAKTIADIRAVRDQYATDASLYLGGVPMIRSDMVDFVKADMALFGAIIVVLLGSALYLFFRCQRWLFIPLATVFVTVLWTIGILAALGQPATAVSSSFIALLAIVSISFSVHLISEYRDLSGVSLELSQHELAMKTMRNKMAPCFYTAFTTGVAFASLTTSNIVPVVDFGWMMMLGIGIALVVSLMMFASVMVLLPKRLECETLIELPAFNEWFARVSTEQPRWLILTGFAFLVLSVIGISQLNVGNRIVEYFRADTEIRQGLEFIDQNLGGTIPMDVIVSFPPYQEADAVEDDPFAGSFDPFAEEEPDSYPQRFWFTPEKLAIVDQLQTFIESRSETGKSISVANLERVARGFTDGEPLTYLELTAILDAVPEDVRSDLISPYVAPEEGHFRISTRLHETGDNYDLQTLITDIEEYATEEMGLNAQDVRVTGIALLFNGMLEQLLDSQLSTASGVIIATFVMFALLLRSMKLAAIGLAPNILAALMILGFMGMFGIPLDMMTITIAAIVIGIGVDDAIHYLHRYKKELDKGTTAREAVVKTHHSTGKALYFTSFTVIAGLSVLVFSRFMPTVYFGLLAALAMVLALTANLSVLPALLVGFTDDKRESKNEIFEG
jgi:predicted RND superfamily exporter protein